MEIESTPIINSEFCKVVVPVIDSAIVKVDIMMFKWDFDKSGENKNLKMLNDAIFAAAARGVSVRVITNDLLARRALTKPNIKARGYITPGIMHSKLLMIDEKHLIMGSHNFTSPGLGLNVETSILIKNCDCIDKLTGFFNTLFEHGAN